jgi:hypothetical protein
VPGRDVSDFLRDIAIIVLGFLGVVALLRLGGEVIRSALS